MSLIWKASGLRIQELQYTNFVIYFMKYKSPFPETLSRLTDHFVVRVDSKRKFNFTQIFHQHGSLANLNMLEQKIRLKET